MSLTQQFRHFFIVTSLTILLATVIALGLGSTESWAVTSLTSLTNPVQTHIATLNRGEAITKNIETKTQGGIGKMTGTGDSKTQAEDNAIEFKSKTLEGINSSIINPDYQSSGKSKQAESEDNQSTKDIKAEAREAFN